MIKVTGTVYGDWDKLNRILHNLSDSNNEHQDVVEDLGNEVADRIYQAISNQEIDLEPLVEEYRKRKQQAGYGNDILIRTSDYVNSIDVTDVQVQGHDIKVTIGIMDGTTETGLSMQELAYYLEYGTEDMVGRRPIEKSWEHIKEDIKAEAERRIREIIRSDLDG